MNKPDSLHILLTNDDGHEAPGIRALQLTLKSKGYRVSLVAPSSEQSATSMSTTTRRNLALEEFESGSWHLDAQPADTVLVALRHLLEDDPPDLVLSGINFGSNLGVGLHASGTIGAAIIATWPPADGSSSRGLDGTDDKWAGSVAPPIVSLSASN